MNRQLRYILCLIGFFKLSVVCRLLAGCLEFMILLEKKTRAVCVVFEKVLVVLFFYQSAFD